MQDRPKRLESVKTEQRSSNEVIKRESNTQVSDKYFMIESANDCWKKQKDRLYQGMDGLGSLAAELDEGYDYKIKHCVKLTPTYG